MSIRTIELKRRAKALANPQRAAVNRWFFKAGKGQYGEGDQFIGLTVPQCRTLAKQFGDLGLPDVLVLLKSPEHEIRLICLLILVHQYELGNAAVQQKIYAAYLKSTRWINNWDLVDASAYKIVGRHLRTRNHAPLLRLARSPSVWERRIAIVATLEFIAHRRFDTTLTIATMLMRDPHDLIHKATGWMLREVGKRDQAVLERFLNHNASNMPRTMLRCAIERLPKLKRQWYMKR